MLQVMADVALMLTSADVIKMSVMLVQKVKNNGLCISWTTLKSQLLSFGSLFMMLRSHACSFSGTGFPGDPEMFCIAIDGGNVSLNNRA